MKILNLLNEAPPLPDDWDKSVYSDRETFKRRIEYAKERAERIGAGSSRIAFLIPYEGRDTVLKIAKNNKGMGQNEAEVSAFRDANYLGADGICVVPMIDYDDTSSRPTWIHTEYAPRLKSKQQFERLTGYELDDVLNYISDVVHNKRVSYVSKPIEELKVMFDGDIWDDEYFGTLFTFLGDTGTHLADLTHYENWGVYNGKPVIIDLGLNQDVWDTYYARK